jgi:21S rRNA (uridine2791-2'-O)-methyltransferase
MSIEISKLYAHHLITTMKTLVGIVQRFAGSVITTRCKSNSSGRWLQRQKNDAHTKLSRSENYRSRAAYKLIELDDKFRIFNSKSRNIVDLGFAPGAWTQVALERCHKKSVPHPNILGIDLINCSPPAGTHFIQGNILSKATHDAIRSHFGDTMESPVDVVLSDMMQNTSGLKDNDHFSSMDLCDGAIILSHTLLKDGGTLVMKFFTGKEDTLLLNKMKKMFKYVYRMKPHACRNESREMYIIGLKRKSDRMLINELFANDQT